MVRTDRMRRLLARRVTGAAGAASLVTDFKRSKHRSMVEENKAKSTHHTM